MGYINTHLRSSDGPTSKTARYTAVVSSRQVEPVIKRYVALEPNKTVSIKAWNNEVCLENRNNN